MRKICITLSIIVIIILTIVIGAGSNQTKNNEYLRIHIRANSNETVDQNIKYIIKDKVVNYLTPLVSKCESKESAIKMLNNEKMTIKRLIDRFLENSQFNYRCNVLIKNELFPTRVYEDVTLENGYYDAVIIELGEAKGDNWWCVVYPPLCFTQSENITYRSKILEIIQNFKKKNDLNCHIAICNLF